MTQFGRRQFIGCGVAAGAAGGLAAPYIARAAGPIQLKLANGDSAQHPEHQVALHYAELVEQRSNGRIRIRVFSGGQLGSETNIVAGLKTGIVDLAMQSSGFLEQFFPRIQVLDLPFMFRDAPSAERLLDGAVGDTIMSGMTDSGYHGLCWGTYGWRQTETISRPVHTPADMKGLRFRVQPAPVFSAMMNAVGAAPVAMDITEVYIALSQNTVQGVEVPFLDMVADKFYEVVKYVALTDHVYNAGALLTGKARFESMAPEDRQVLREAAKELTPYWRSLFAQRSEEDRKFCEGKGVAVNAVDYEAFRSIMLPIYGQFRERIGPDLLDQVVHATST